jgi:hypothetical protein
MTGDAVLRFRDGKTDRVRIDDPDIDHAMLHVTRENGEKGDVPFSQLKAVFFPSHNPDHAYPEAGMAVAIEFADGEVIRGTAQYNPEKNGFFLYPADRSKSDRIFVVNSAILSIEVEKL